MALLGGVAMATMSGTSIAVQAGTPEPVAEEAQSAPTETIVITGSRLRRTGADTPAPTTIIDSDLIMATGATEIADIINQIPSMFVSQTNQTSNQSSNPGLNALDLRGLGVERTLVLVNGRRRVPAMPGNSAVDVSAIPSALVEQVHVVTGGASALYGADAVAGATNFILKRRYEGVSANVQYGASTRGDMQNYSASGLWGQNFADGRGNVTVFGFYGDYPDSVAGQDRPWTARGYPLYSRPEGQDVFNVRDGVYSIYASNQAMVLLGGDLYSFSPDGSVRAPVLGPSGILDPGRYDLNDPNNVGNLSTDGGEFDGRYHDWFLQVPTERFAAHGSLSYELTPNLSYFLELDFARNRSTGKYAARSSYGADTVPLDSPFITDEMRALAGSLAAPLPFTRRYDEFGRPETRIERQLTQFLTGFEGELPDLLAGNWTWTAHYSYGETQADRRRVNATADGRFSLALDSTTDSSGAAVCRSTLTDPGNGCVPLNPFLPAGADVIGYLQHDTGSARATMSQHVASGYLTGDLFNLPAGAVQAVIGAEYRKERNDIGVIAEYEPTDPAFDPLLGRTETALVGEYDVAEVFGELRVPIITGQRFIEQLSVEGAARFSEYNTAGQTTAWSAGVEWAPVSDLRLRTTYGRAVRAPNIAELYTSGSISGAWLTDPCNDYNVQYRVTNTEYTAANCAQIAPGDRDTYWLWTDIVNQGNTDLDVETAHTLTVGAVFRPRITPGLTLTVDYFDIDLDGAIGTFDAQTILDKCVDAPSLDNMFCPLVERDGSSNLVSVLTQRLNLSNFRTRGVDMEASYGFELSSLGLPSNAGGLTVNAVYTRLLERSFTVDPDFPDEVDETVGVFGAPRWKGAVRTTYANGPLSLNWTMRHFSPMRPDSTVSRETHDPAFTDHVFYNDIYASWWLTDAVSVYGGLNNAFDRAPPRLPGAESGGANFEFGYQAGVYDVIGRTFFVGLRYTR